MIVVSFDKELREAFDAGRAAGMTPFVRAKWGKDGDTFFANVPLTYEDWIASKANDPKVAIG